MRQADGLSEAFFYYGGTTPTPPTPSEDQNAILVTNEYVQKYLEEVTYKGIENEETKILGYPGGGPGEADIPPTHTIAWTADATVGALNLKVWESDWSRDYSLPAGASEQGISNLVPNREYKWTVTSTADGKVVAGGSFKTKGLLHQVYFEPKGRNARDLSGWKGLGGKTLAFRKLYRGGAIHGSRTDAKGKAEFRAQGIKAELNPTSLPSPRWATTSPSSLRVSKAATTT